MKTAGKAPVELKTFPSTWLNRFIPLRRLGWAFLLAWVFCIFYTGVVEGYTGRTSVSESALMVRLFFSALPVFMSIVMLVVIVGGEKRLGSPTEHPALFWLAPLLTALSTPLLFVSFGPSDLTMALFTFGSVLTGVGSGLMWVMWGEYYARSSQEQVEQLAPISAIIAAILVLVLSSMSGWIAVVTVTLFPVLSGVCFALAWKDTQLKHTPEASYEVDSHALARAHDEAKNSPLQVLRSMGRTGLGILTACLFVCLAGTFWTESDKGSWDFQLVLVVSILFTALIAFASTGGPRRITLSFLYRWMCPALVLGFVAVIVLTQDTGTYLAYTVSIAARFGFCLITQMYFARYTAQGRATAVQAFGLGWLFVHVGDFLGVITYTLLGDGMTAGFFTLDQVAALSIGVLVVITMFVLNDEKSFSLAKKTNPREAELISSAHDTTTSNSENLLQQSVQMLAQQGELTPRETEVLGLLARGRSVPYIRDALIISKETAATHVKHIYAKLDVHSRQELLDLIE